MTDRDNNTSTSPLPTPTLQSGNTNSRRRRLLTGAAAGTGVFMAVQARTALGAVKCQSPSAMISGNMSQRPGDGTTCSGGRSPGFWKQPQHFPYWGPSGLVLPTFYSGIAACSTGLGNVTPCDIKTKGTLLGNLLLGAPGGSNYGVWEVLVWPTSYPLPSSKYPPGTAKCSKNLTNTDVFGGKGQLMRALVCAYLNAAWFNSSSQDYPITMQQVLDMWDAVKNGGLYCPKGMTCKGGGLSGAQIISYIEGMYDINADIDVDLCKIGG